MRFNNRLLTLLTLILISITASAADISGKVQIKDGDSPLKNNAGAVVFIDGLSKTDWPIPKNVPTMASSKKIFKPGVLAIQKGMTIEFPNDDTILHNVFSLSKTKPFDLGLYKKGERKTVKFDNPGIVKVYCNIHENMIGHILVLENPFYAVTDRKGNYKISGAPSGSAKIRIWHPQTNSISEKIAIGGNDQQKNFELNKQVVSKKHRNKWGMPYKSKY